MAKRAVVIVIDGLGVGELPDAAQYGDAGNHTLDNMARAAGGIKVKTLASLGLGLIEGVNSIEKIRQPIGSYGRMSERSPAKDTTTGHWEITGVILERPFSTFPEGFPSEMMEKFRQTTGCEYLWGKPASGTEIINKLGERHMKTRSPIVYTSADSVFQIAAHEDIMDVEELYRICLVARGFLNEYNVGRVIARPFTGRVGSFRRTERRKDFSIPPCEDTLLDILKGAGLEVAGIGKLPDIFAHRGFTKEMPASGNEEILDAVEEALRHAEDGLIFADLVDFDMLYGHRNDVFGFARALEAADVRVSLIMNTLGPEDILFITADHGCDPTTPSTDHSREYAPVLVYGRRIKKGVNLGTRRSFSDLGQSIAGYFGLRLKNGESFLDEVLRAG
jgi:phosphopentomutase